MGKLAAVLILGVTGSLAFCGRPIAYGTADAGLYLGRGLVWI